MSTSGLCLTKPNGYTQELRGKRDVQQMDEVAGLLPFSELPRHKTIKDQPPRLEPNKWSLSHSSPGQNRSLGA
jgi:hypothetical protein